MISAPALCSCSLLLLSAPALCSLFLLSALALCSRSLLSLRSLSTLALSSRGLALAARSRVSALCSLLSAPTLCSLLLLSAPALCSCSLLLLSVLCSRSLLSLRSLSTFALGSRGLALAARSRVSGLGSCSISAPEEAVGSMDILAVGDDAGLCGCRDYLPVQQSCQLQNDSWSILAGRRTPSTALLSKP